MIRGVLFDMDGVLLDTERLGSRLFEQACARRGYAVPEKLYLSLLGCTAQAGFDVLHEAFGPDFPCQAVMDEVHQGIFHTAVTTGLPTKKGLAECLTGLRARSLRLALATSTDRAIVERYVQATPAMQDAFDVMICGPEGGRSKPEPDIYLEAARRLGLSPGECLGVEDSRNGLRSLTAAGCVSVMIPDLLPYDDSLAPYVKHRLSDLGQLCALADRLNLEARARS